MIFMNSSFLKLICNNKEWELIHILVLDGVLSDQVQSILSCCNQLQHPLKIKLTNHIQRWRLTIAVVLALVLLIFQVFTNFSKVKATEIGKYTFVTPSFKNHTLSFPRKVKGKRLQKRRDAWKKGTEQAEKTRYVGKTLQETARWAIETVLVNWGYSHLAHLKVRFVLPDKHAIIKSSMSN